MTGKDKATGKPPARWNIELSTTLVSKGLEIENSILKGNCVGSFAISYCPKLGDGNTVRSGF